MFRAVDLDVAERHIVPKIPHLFLEYRRADIEALIYQCGLAENMDKIAAENKEMMEELVLMSLWICIEAMELRLHQIPDILIPYYKRSEELLDRISKKMDNFEFAF